MYERYHHDVVGVNSRLDSMQAGVLKAKLPYLDTYNEARRNAAYKYNQAIWYKVFLSTVGPFLILKSNSSFHCLFQF